MDIIGEIRKLVERSVEFKITEACLPDAICNDIEDMTADTIDKIDDLLNELDKNIDNTIENFDREEEIKNIKDDIRTQDYMEASLWN